MSVIIAYKKDNKIAMGCDSIICNSKKTISENSGSFKVTKIEIADEDANYTAFIGYTGSNIKNINDIKNTYIISIKNREHTYSKAYAISCKLAEICSEDKGVFLLVCHLGIYKIFPEYNWSVQPIEEDFAAIGAGEQIALGAMSILKKQASLLLDINTINYALDAACEFSTLCRNPRYLFTHEYNES